MTSWPCRARCGAIANKIQGALAPQEQERLAHTPPVNPAAHEAYLKGTYLNRGTNEQRRKAREYFKQAVSIDPGYAPAYAGLADYYWATPELPAGVAMPKPSNTRSRPWTLTPPWSAVTLPSPLSATTAIGTGRRRRRSSSAPSNSTQVTRKPAACIPSIHRRWATARKRWPKSVVLSNSTRSPT